MLDKKQLTVRLPVHLYDYLYERASQNGKSLNDMLVDITEEHMKWLKAEQTFQKMTALREKSQYSGAQPDSIPDLRKLREGERDE